MLLLKMMTGPLLPQGIVSLILYSLNAYKPFYSEIMLNSLKNNPSLQTRLFLPEPEASVARLIDDEAISVGDNASADNAAAKSDK